MPLDVAIPSEVGLSINMPILGGVGLLYISYFRLEENKMFFFLVKYTTVLVKSFAHLNCNFLLAFLEEIKVSPPLSGGSRKIHSIKCAKLLTSTVNRTCPDICQVDREGPFDTGLTPKKMALN